MGTPTHPKKHSPDGVARKNGQIMQNKWQQHNIQELVALYDLINNNKHTQFHKLCHKTTKFLSIQAAKAINRSWISKNRFYRSTSEGCHEFGEILKPREESNRRSQKQAPTAGLIVPFKCAHLNQAPNHWEEVARTFEGRVADIVRLTHPLSDEEGWASFWHLWKTTKNNITEKELSSHNLRSRGALACLHTARQILAIVCGFSSSHFEF